jgi:hypothetical protein
VREFGRRGQTNNSSTAQSVVRPPSGGRFTAGSKFGSCVRRSRPPKQICVIMFDAEDTSTDVTNGLWNRDNMRVYQCFLNRAVFVYPIRRETFAAANRAVCNRLAALPPTRRDRCWYHAVPTPTPPVPGLRISTGHGGDALRSRHGTEVG